MFETIVLFFRLIAISIKSQMQHRASFLMLVLAHFLATFVDIFGIWVLFDRFNMLKGWTLKEVGLIYGIMHVSFAIAESSARGFDTFWQLIKHGDFDRLLLRPRGTLFQIASRDFQMMRLGRFFQGIVILSWSFTQLEFSFLSWSSLTILLSIIGAASLFYGLFILQATFSFWTIETLEVMNITTYGGVETGQYPMSIYTPGFRAFFTFIIPLACVAYYPISILIHHNQQPFWLSFLFPFAGILFFIISCKMWEFGVGHYHSTGN